MKKRLNSFDFYIVTIGLACLLVSTAILIVRWDDISKAVSIFHGFCMGMWVAVGLVNLREARTRNVK